MRNAPLGEYEAAELEARIKRILRDCGNPEPPLDLEVVLEALKLDLRYYSLKDPGLLDEIVHRVRVAGHQLAQVPSRLFEVVRKADLKALWTPERRRILIDKDVPEAKRRRMAAHEVVHSVLPWHQKFLLGDHSASLSLECEDTLEREANAGASELLFLLDRFSADARDLPLRIDTAFRLGDRFGNTYTSTLWHLTEKEPHGVPMVSLVSQNPRHPQARRPPDEPAIKYTVVSPSFRGQFPGVSDEQLLSVISAYVQNVDLGPAGEHETTLYDVNGDPHLFRFESEQTEYVLLTMGVYVRPLGKKRPTIVRTPDLGRHGEGEGRDNPVADPSQRDAMSSSTAANLIDLAELVIEAFAKQHPDRQKPRATKYVIRVDKDRRTVDVPEMTGSQILALVGKNPTTHKLYQRVRRSGRGEVEEVPPNKTVSFVAPGVERFMTIPCDTTEGSDA